MEIRNKYRVFNYQVLNGFHVIIINILYYIDGSFVKHSFYY